MNTPKTHSTQKKPVALLYFPGTQCDEDVIKALISQNHLVKKIHYSERFFFHEYSAFILPGGFSYGDYLRAGALAAYTPAIMDLKTAAKKGYPVLGICNGFQILCEVGLLEGALRINHHLRFIDQWVELNLCSPSPYWGSINISKKIRIPIAHKEGAFYGSKNLLEKLKEKEQIWWQYEENPNGSIENIAGIMNERKNVAGLMPHPERAMANWMGGLDGVAFFKF